MDAATKEMLSRRAAVDLQLALLRLQAHDVAGDGNCLFRAISYATYGTESRHDELRAKAASCILYNKTTIINKFGLNESQLNRVVSDVSTLGTAVGEHALFVLPTVLKRDVTVHIAYAEPQVLTSMSHDPSAASTDLPVHIAFYDGLLGGVGHYKAVLPHHSSPTPSLLSASTLPPVFCDQIYSRLN